MKLRVFPGFSGAQRRAQGLALLPLHPSAASAASAPLGRLNRAGAAAPRSCPVPGLESGRPMSLMSRVLNTRTPFSLSVG